MRYLYLLIFPLMFMFNCGDDETPSVEEVVEIPEGADAGFLKTVGEKMDLPPDSVTVEILASLRILDLSKTGLTSLDGIEYCTFLHELYIDSNDISDLSPLAGLSKLRILHANANKISNLAGLEELLELEDLQLTSNIISNLSPLSNLDLHSLSLDYNSISNLEPISSNINLEFLDLQVNQLSDVKSLSSLINLNTLYLSGNDIDDLSSLSTLTKLGVLLLNKNNLTNVDPLADLKELHYIELQDNKLKSLKFNNLKKLYFLNLNNNDLPNLQGLEGATALNELYVSSNQLSSVEGLQSLTKLTVLSLSNNNLDTIPHLDKTGNLEKLYVYNNKFTSLASMGITQSPKVFLRLLSASGNQIEDLTGLGTLASTEYDYVVPGVSGSNVNKILETIGVGEPLSLFLQHNQLKSEDLKEFAALESLVLLNIGNNDIDTIGSLVSNKKLQKLFVDSTAISAISVLDSLPDLQEVDLIGNSMLNKSTVDEYKKRKPDVKVTF